MQPYGVLGIDRRVFIAQSMSMTSWQSANAAMHGSRAKFPHRDADFLVHNASRPNHSVFLPHFMPACDTVNNQCQAHVKGLF